MRCLSRLLPDTRCSVPSPSQPCGDPGTAPSPAWAPQLDLHIAGMGGGGMSGKGGERNNPSRAGSGDGILGCEQKCLVERATSRRGEPFGVRQQERGADPHHTEKWGVGPRLRGTPMGTTKG